MGNTIKPQSSSEFVEYKFPPNILRLLGNPKYLFACPELSEEAIEALLGSWRRRFELITHPLMWFYREPKPVTIPPRNRKPEEENEVVDIAVTRPEISVYFQFGPNERGCVCLQDYSYTTSDKAYRQFETLFLDELEKNAIDINQSPNGHTLQFVIQLVKLREQHREPAFQNAAEICQFMGSDISTAEVCAMMAAYPAHANAILEQYAERFTTPNTQLAAVEAYPGCAEKYFDALISAGQAKRLMKARPDLLPRILEAPASSRGNSIFDPKTVIEGTALLLTIAAQAAAQKGPS